MPQHPKKVRSSMSSFPQRAADCRPRVLADERKPHLLLRRRIEPAAVAHVSRCSFDSAPPQIFWFGRLLALRRAEPWPSMIPQVAAHKIDSLLH